MQSFCRRLRRSDSYWMWFPLKLCVWTLTITEIDQGSALLTWTPVSTDLEFFLKFAHVQHGFRIIWPLLSLVIILLLVHHFSGQTTTVPETTTTTGTVCLMHYSNFSVVTKPSSVILSLLCIFLVRTPWANVKSISKALAGYWPLWFMCSLAATLYRLSMTIFHNETLLHQQ